MPTMIMIMIIVRRRFILYIYGYGSLPFDRQQCIIISCNPITSNAYQTPKCSVVLSHFKVTSIIIQLHNRSHYASHESWLSPYKIRFIQNVHIGIWKLHPKQFNEMSKESALIHRHAEATRLKTLNTFWDPRKSTLNEFFRLNRVNMCVYVRCMQCGLFEVCSSTQPIP